MKHLARLCILALVLMLAVPVLAQAPAPGVWHTGFTARNLSFYNSTPVAIDFYDASGTSVASWDGQLGPKGSIFLYSGNISGLPEETSARVGSNESVAVVANVASDWPDKTESAYVGMRDYVETDTELFAPGVYKNYYDNSSAIRVMNVGGFATCVRVRYYRIGEATPTYTEYQTVPSNAGYTFLQEDNPNLGTSFVGSAVIDSVNQMGTCTGGYDGRRLSALTHISIDPGPSTGNPFPWRLHAVHNPVKGGGCLAYLPVLANDYYGNVSALTIMNMRASGQYVRVYFSGSNYTEKYIAPNSSELWYVPNEGPPVGWLGTGKAVCINYPGGQETTNCEIVATVNQINVDHGNFASYNGFTENEGKRVSHFPVVVKDYTDEDYTTTITCMNLENDWVLIRLQLDNVSVLQQWVPGGGAYSWYLGNVGAVPSGYNGGGYAYAYYASQKIACLAQQNADSASQDGDWLTTYNGVPTP